MVKLASMIRIISFLNLVFVSWASNTKTWIPSSNTSYLQLWNTRIIMDSFSFPSDLLLPMVMEKGKNKCEAIFPIDDESIYNLSMLNFTFGDPTDTIRKIPKGCPDEDINNKTERIHWTDPRNWKQSIKMDPIPHLERIPCAWDVVQIKNESNTFILLPDKPITIKSLRFTGQNGFSRYVTQQRFQTLATTDETFFKHFIVKGGNDFSKLINISGQACADRTGCMCGNEQFLEDVCDIMDDTCTYDLPCERPVQPYGHCCEICGSYMRLFYNKDTFVLDKLNTFAFKFITQEQEKLEFNFLMYVSKVSEGEIQLILLGENGYTSQVEETARKLRDAIISKTQLGISYSKFRSSGAKKTLSWGLKRYAFVIFLVVLAVISSLIYYYFRVKKLGNRLQAPTAGAVKSESTSGSSKYDGNHTEDTKSPNSIVAVESTSQIHLETSAAVEEPKPEDVIDLLDSFT